MKIALTVNGKPLEADVDPGMLLVQLLRDHLGLTGDDGACPIAGCDMGQCGSCTVHVDGRAIRACSLLAVQVAGSVVTTIDGLTGPDGRPHPMREAFEAHRDRHCGSCLPGIVMSAVDLASRKTDLSEQDIRAGLEGTMCKCAGYQAILDAVRAGAAAMRD